MIRRGGMVHLYSDDYTMTTTSNHNHNTNTPNTTGSPQSTVGYNNSRDQAIVGTPPHDTTTTATPALSLLMEFDRPGGGYGISHIDDYIPSSVSPISTPTRKQQQQQQQQQLLLQEQQQSATPVSQQHQPQAARETNRHFDLKDTNQDGPLNSSTGGSSSTRTTIGDNNNNDKNVKVTSHVNNNKNDNRAATSSSSAAIASSSSSTTTTTTSFITKWMERQAAATGTSTGSSAAAATTNVTQPQHHQPIIPTDDRRHFRFDQDDDVTTTNSTNDRLSQTTTMSTTTTTMSEETNDRIIHSYLRKHQQQQQQTKPPESSSTTTRTNNVAIIRKDVSKKRSTSRNADSKRYKNGDAEDDDDDDQSHIIHPRARCATSTTKTDRESLSSSRSRSRTTTNTTRNGRQDHSMDQTPPRTNRNSMSVTKMKKVEEDITNMEPTVIATNFSNNDFSVDATDEYFSNLMMSMNQTPSPEKGAFQKVLSPFSSSLYRNDSRGRHPYLSSNRNDDTAPTSTIVANVMPNVSLTACRKVSVVVSIRSLLDNSRTTKTNNRISNPSYNNVFLFPSTITNESKSTTANTTPTSIESKTISFKELIVVNPTAVLGSSNNNMNTDTTTNPLLHTMEMAKIISQMIPSQSSEDWIQLFQYHYILWWTRPCTINNNADYTNSNNSNSTAINPSHDIADTIESVYHISQAIVNDIMAPGSIAQRIVIGTGTTNTTVSTNHKGYSNMELQQTQQLFGRIGQQSVAHVLSHQQQQPHPISNGGNSDGDDISINMIESIIHQYGIAGLTLHSILHRIAQWNHTRNNHSSYYHCTISILEISTEGDDMLYDLLASRPYAKTKPHNGTVTLRYNPSHTDGGSNNTDASSIKSSTTNNSGSNALFTVVGLSETSIDSVKQFGHLIRRAYTAALHPNRLSKRGHIIVTVHVRCDVNASTRDKNIVGDTIMNKDNHTVLSSKRTMTTSCQFVDLAMAGHDDDKSTIKENYNVMNTKNNNLRRRNVTIRKSLWALSGVLRGLLLKEAGNDIPISYRESMLTKVLQRSMIQIDSRTILLATVAPEIHSYEETMTTLRYVNRLLHRPGQIVQSPFYNCPESQTRPFGSPNPTMDGTQDPTTTTSIRLDELIDQGRLLKEIVSDPRQRLAKVLQPNYNPPGSPVQPSQSPQAKPFALEDDEYIPSVYSDPEEDYLIPDPLDFTTTSSLFQEDETLIHTKGTFLKPMKQEVTKTINQSDHDFVRTTYSDIDIDQSTAPLSEFTSSSVQREEYQSNSHSIQGRQSYSSGEKDELIEIDDHWNSRDSAATEDDHAAPTPPTRNITKSPSNNDNYPNSDSISNKHYAMSTNPFDTDYDEDNIYHDGTDSNMSAIYCLKSIHEAEEGEQKASVQPLEELIQRGTIDEEIVFVRSASSESEELESPAHLEYNANDSDKNTSNQSGLLNFSYYLNEASGDVPSLLSEKDTPFADDTQNSIPPQNQHLSIDNQAQHFADDSYHINNENNLQSFHPETEYYENVDTFRHDSLIEANLIGDELITAYDLPPESPSEYIPVQMHLIEKKEDISKQVLNDREQWELNEHNENHQTDVSSRIHHFSKGFDNFVTEEESKGITKSNAGNMSELDDVMNSKEGKQPLQQSWKLPPTLQRLSSPSHPQSVSNFVEEVEAVESKIKKTLSLDNTTMTDHDRSILNSWKPSPIDKIQSPSSSRWHSRIHNNDPSLRSDDAAQKVQNEIDQLQAAVDRVKQTNISVWQSSLDSINNLRYFQTAHQETLAELLVDREAANKEILRLEKELARRSEENERITIQFEKDLKAAHENTIKAELDRGEVVKIAEEAIAMQSELEQKVSLLERKLSDVTASSVPRQDYDELKRTIVSLETELSERNNQIEMIGVELEKSKLSNSQMQDSLQNMQDEHRELLGKVASHQNELSKLKEDALKAHDAKLDADSRIEEMTRRFDELQASSVLRDDYDALQYIVKTLEHDLDNQNDLVSNLEDDLEEYKRSIEERDLLLQDERQKQQELLNQLSTLQKGLEVSKEHLKNAEHAKIEAISRVASITQLHNDAQTREGNLKDKLEEALRNIEQAQKYAIRCQQETDVTKMELNALQEEVAAEREKLQNEVSMLRNEVEELRSKNEEYPAQLNKYDREYTSLKTERDALLQEMEQTKRSLQSRISDVRALTNSVEELLSEKEKSQSKIRKMEKVLSSFQEETRSRLEVVLLHRNEAASLLEKTVNENKALVSLNMELQTEIESLRKERNNSQLLLQERDSEQSRKIYSRPPTSRRQNDANVPSVSRRVLDEHVDSNQRDDNHNRPRTKSNQDDDAIDRAEEVAAHVAYSAKAMIETASSMMNQNNNNYTTTMELQEKIYSMEDNTDYEIHTLKSRIKQLERRIRNVPINHGSN